MTHRRARPVGRRRGDPEDTRRAILAAARSEFADVGFDRATIRAIATSANVDPALVLHHFTNKQQLFASAHELPQNPADLLADVVRARVDQRGELLVRSYLDMLIQPDSAALSLLRTAATNAAAAAMLREFITSALLEHAEELAPGVGSQRRIALCGAHLLGIVFARQLLELGPLVEADIDTIVSDVAPVIQHYLVGESSL